MSKVKERYSGSIALTKLQHVKMTAKGQSGPVEGIFIPVKQNYMVKGKLQKDDVNGADIPNSEPLYLSVDVVIMNERNENGQDGFISHKMDSASYKAMGKEEANKIKLPILGNIKNFANNTSNDSVGDVGGGKVFDPQDGDLPF